MTVYQNCRKRTYKLKSNLDLGEESGFLGSKKILLFVLLANFLRTPSTHAVRWCLLGDVSRGLSKDKSDGRRVRWKTDT
jgi:hypothetical protein